MMMPFRKFSLNILLVAISVIFSIFMAEGILRFLRPNSGLGAGFELAHIRNHPMDLTKTFTIDPEFGFRPVLGNGHFNEYGTLPNAYRITKTPHTERILFIGDSVTNRGKIITALRELYGEEKFEYWNAGVESFNTVQEVNFYKKYNAAIKPDHVILTFHLNDFETTPIAFFQEDKLVVYAPNASQKFIYPWLFQHSYVYRLLIRFTIARIEMGRESISQEVENSLVELKTVLSASDIKFTIIILPYLKPYQKWHPQMKINRDRILDMVNRHKIRYFDLLSALNNAIRHGVNIQEEIDDPFHPSEEASVFFAKYLYEKHVF